MSKKSIWLEIAHVRLEEEQGAECRVRFKADKTEPASWWLLDVPSRQTAESYQRILDGLDNHRVVLGKLGSSKDSELVCLAIRIQTPDR